MSRSSDTVSKPISGTNYKEGEGPEPKNVVKAECDQIQDAFWDTEKAQLLLREADAKLDRVRGDMQEIRKRLKAFREKEEN